MQRHQERKLCCTSVSYCGTNDTLYCCCFNWPMVDSMKMWCSKMHLFPVHPVLVRFIFCLHSAAEAGAVCCCLLPWAAPLSMEGYTKCELGHKVALCFKGHMNLQPLRFKATWTTYSVKSCWQGKGRVVCSTRLYFYDFQGLLFISGLAESNLSFIFCSWMLQRKQKWGLDLPDAEDLICLSGHVRNGDCNLCSSSQHASVQRR